MLYNNIISTAIPLCEAKSDYLFGFARLDCLLVFVLFEAEIDKANIDPMLF